MDKQMFGTRIDQLPGSTPVPDNNYIQQQMPNVQMPPQLMPPQMTATNYQPLPNAQMVHPDVFNSYAGNTYPHQLKPQGFLDLLNADFFNSLKEPALLAGISFTLQQETLNNIILMLLPNIIRQLAGTNITLNLIKAILVAVLFYLLRRMLN